MLVANETVAEHFAKLKLPFIYQFTKNLKLKKYRSLLTLLLPLEFEYMEQLIL